MSPHGHSAAVLGCLSALEESLFAACSERKESGERGRGFGQVQLWRVWVTFGDFSSSFDTGCKASGRKAQGLASNHKLQHPRKRAMSDHRQVKIEIFYIVRVQHDTWGVSLRIWDREFSFASSVATVTRLYYTVSPCLEFQQDLPAWVLLRSRHRLLGAPELVCERDC